MPRPIWELFNDGSDASVPWKDHQPNRRFAIFNPGGTTTPLDDLVWDKETGLIWPRNANLNGAALNWLDANTSCRTLMVANRIGWRLPRVEELSSLVDHRYTNPALPQGHPFMSVQAGSGVWGYWSSTNHENPDAAAWFVNFTTGDAGLATKGGNPQVLGFIWPVRGGCGGVNWNW
jgi:ABC-type glycerol-3-phosphate transport system substrate-binding protein